MQGEAAVGEQAHVDDQLGLMPGAKGEHCQGDEPQGQRPDDSAGIAVLGAWVALMSETPFRPGRIHRNSG